MKTYCGSGGSAACILNLGTKWKWDLSFTPRTLYLRGKNPRYQLDTGLAGPRADLEAMAKRKYSIIAPAENWAPVVQPAA
jgi:hypothetical protein